MIDWQTVTRFISAYVIPIVFGIMILIVFIALIWNWNHLGDKIKGLLGQLV